MDKLDRKLLTMRSPQVSSEITIMRKPLNGGHELSRSTVARKAEKIHRLHTEIVYYDLMYYVFKESVITDDEYQQLKAELVTAVNDCPLAAAEAPKARAIRDQLLSRDRDARHDFPMLELRETYDIHGLKRWFDLFDAKDVVISPNVIGVEVELIYVGGTLHKAINRGDGLIGKDITINMYGVNGIPQQIPETDRVNIHGKVAVALDKQAKLPVWVDSCPSMCAAHLMLNMFNTETNTNHEYLDFIPQVVNIPGVTMDHIDLREILIGWGFKGMVQRIFSGKIREVGALEESIDAFYTKELNTLPYPYKGVTFIVNETQRRLELGYTSRSPEYAVKYIPK